MTTTTEYTALRGFTVMKGRVRHGEGSADVLAYVDPGDRFPRTLLCDKVAALMVERGEIEYARSTS